PIRLYVARPCCLLMRNALYIHLQNDRRLSTRFCVSVPGAALTGAQLTVKGQCVAAKTLGAGAQLVAVTGVGQARIAYQVVVGPGAPNQPQTWIGHRHFQPGGDLAIVHDSLDHVFQIGNGAGSYQDFIRCVLAEITVQIPRHPARADIAVLELDWNTVFTMHEDGAKYAGADTNAQA